tara:strand:- start:51 stop:536 length:486 start_codon:yes stop_codon:yes gene_type:complete
MSLQIKENFLSEKEYIDIYSLLTSDYFPWYFNGYKSSPVEKKLFNYQFTHSFYNNDKVNSDYFNALQPILTKLNYLSLIRIKANLNPISNKLIEYEPHKDKLYKCKVAIYYVNTNNGYTMIKDEKIKSKKNRMVLFDSTLEHYGTNSTDCNNRMVINFNYF